MFIYVHDIYHSLEIEQYRMSTFKFTYATYSSKNIELCLSLGRILSLKQQVTIHLVFKETEK